MLKIFLRNYMTINSQNSSNQPSKTGVVVPAVQLLLERRLQAMKSSNIQQQKSTAS
jgi:hypothetical protein